jgi:hypothetical protein
MAKSFALLAVLLILCVTASVYAEPNIKEGKWEITALPEVKGMEGKIPAQVNSQCITKKEMVPQEPEKGAECKTLEQKVSGDTVTWFMRCTSKDGSGENRGEVTYKGDRFDGVVTMITTRPGEDKMEMKVKLSGKRIGECK